ncbi:MAG: acyl-ACP--UDP-N-acetylglucosamine O-acyltransferase [Planctomycetaceae bacterium]|nr:MAG: acyl-ACP--UDP-N-acetylglucosamine O-acyltransferase [Planctomycetaceae bacterium]
MPKIHPSAVVDPTAEIADDVTIGAYAVIEGGVKIGSGSVIGSHAIIHRYTSLGQGNFVDSFAALGGLPQDLKFDPRTVTYLRIGDFNTFREHVTISRATKPGTATTIGNKTYWMVGSHAGHDSAVDDGVILANNAAVAGHAHIGRKAILSANVLIHQFCWIGEMVMTQGNSGLSMHLPPYTMLADGINRVVGLNKVGIRRNPDFTEEDRRQIKEAFRITYRSGITMTKALAQMDACTDWGEPACRFREFVRKVLTAQPPYNRGLCPMRTRRADAAANGQGNCKLQIVN